MNYKIIQNEEKLIEFIDWLPEISEEECYYLTLFARKKYNSSIKSDKAQLKSFVSNKKYMFRKIKQLETNIGNYTFEDFVVPEDSLVLYISTPRSYKLANQEIIKRLIVDSFNQEYKNPYTISLSCLQTAKSNNHKILLFDIDQNDNLIQQKLDILMNSEAYSLIKTKNGYRIIVYTDKLNEKSKRSFYQKLAGISDQVGDLFIPVVGCIQGGFTPYFVKK